MMEGLWHPIPDHVPYVSFSRLHGTFLVGLGRRPPTTPAGSGGGAAEASASALSQEDWPMLHEKWVT